MRRWMINNAWPLITVLVPFVAWAGITWEIYVNGKVGA